METSSNYQIPWTPLDDGISQWNIYEQTSNNRKQHLHPLANKTAYHQACYCLDVEEQECSLWVSVEHSRSLCWVLGSLCLSNLKRIKPISQNWKLTGGAGHSTFTQEDQSLNGFGVTIMPVKDPPMLPSGCETPPSSQITLELFLTSPLCACFNFGLKTISKLKTN